MNIPAASLNIDNVQLQLNTDTLMKAVDPVYILSRDGRINYINSAACTVLGYSEEELLGLSVQNIDQEFSESSWPDKFREIINGECTYFESIHRRRDNTEFPVANSVNVVNAGNENYICVCARDLSEYKMGIRQMEQLQFAVENATDAVFLTRPSGEIFYVNYSACQQLGYSYDELTSMNVGDINPALTPEIRIQIRGGEGSGELRTIETTHQRKDGIKFPVELTFNYASFGGEGFSVSFVRDITERKAAARQTEELKFAIDNANDAIYLNDRDGGIYYANYSACEQVGYSYEELTSMNIADIDAGFTPDLLHEFLDKGYDGVSPPENPKHRRKDGSTFPVEVTFNSRVYEDVEYFCSFVRDITERKIATRQTEQLHFALENAVDAVYLFNEDGEIFYVNNSACDAMGYSYEELTSMQIRDLNPSFPWLGWPERIEQIRKGDTTPIETSHRRKDGTEFLVEIIINIGEFEGTSYLCAIARDITDRKEVAKRLLITQFAMDSAGDDVIMTNAHGKILYVNNAICEKLGYTREELLKKTVRDINPTLGDEDWDDDDKWLSITDGLPHIFESMHETKDGRRFPVEITATVREFEGQQYSCSFIRDITGRKAAARKMEELQFAMDNAVDLIYILNKDAKIYYANKRACQTLGYSYEELTNMTVYDLDPDCPPDFFQAVWDGGMAGQLESIETYHQKKDGTKFPVEVSISNGVFDGVGYSCTFARDITERKKTQEKLTQYQEQLEELVESRTRELQEAHEELMQKEGLAVLGRLTGVVSHELRNPLGTIRSSIYVLRGKIQEKTGPIARAISRAERNITRCDRIIDELLDFTRNRPLELESVVIDDWLREVLDEYELPATISIETDLEAGIQHRIEIERLRRCIINVLSNACEAMLECSEDEPHVIRLTTKTNKDGFAIKIEDNGPGIPIELRDKVFEPLYSTKGFGIGLGLSIVKQIMEQHKGSVEISSGTKGGTCVRLWFPV